MVKWISVMALSVMIFPLAVQADNLIRINEPAQVVKGQTFEDVVVINSNAEVNGRITGNLVVLHGNADLDNTAYIGGDVICLAGLIKAQPGAMVVGSKVQIGGIIGWNALPFFSIGKLLLLGFMLKLVTAVILLGLSIFMVLMWPHQIAYAAEEASQDLVKASLVGVLAISILIPLSVGFAITLFGLPISLAIAVFLLVASWFGIATISYLIGTKFSTKFSPLLAIIVGFVVLKFIHFVPFIGSALYFIAILPGLGAILLTRFGTNKPWLSSGRAKLPKAK